MLLFLAWTIIIMAIIGGLGFLAGSRRDSGDSGFLGVAAALFSVPVLVVAGILLALGVLLSGG